MSVPKGTQAVRRLRVRYAPKSGDHWHTAFPRFLSDGEPQLPRCPDLPKMKEGGLSTESALCK